MSRCYICDKPINNPEFNSLHKDIDPCGECLEVINDLLGKDVPYTRSEFSEEDTETLSYDEDTENIEDYE